MYWIPYRPSDVKAIAQRFEQTTNLLNFKKMKSLLKSLFFDRAFLKNIKAQRMNKEKLAMYLQAGRISLREYLFLSR